MRHVTVDDRDAEIDRYVLGTASEAERERLEERLFADEEFLALVHDREDALFDDYAQGRLGEADRAAFERSRLATPAGRERLAFARAATRLEPAPSRPQPGVSFRWLPVAASIVLAVATAVLAARTRELGLERKADQARFDARVQELRREIEAERQRPVSGVPDEAPALVLHGQADRAEGETPELALDQAGDPVIVSVPVPAGPYVVYQAVLRTVEGGAHVWETAGLQRMDRKEIRIAIPRDMLGPGDFILTLSGRRVTGPAVELADHYFRVTMDEAAAPSN